MDRFRILFNSLPADVLDEILRINEFADGDSRWQLLRSGKTRKVYRFTPIPDGPSYVVKWGYRCFSSIKKIRRILTGKDDASVEWKNTLRAEENNIPVVPFAVVGAPNIRRGSFDTLLAAPYIEGSRNGLDFIAHFGRESAAVETFIRNLGCVIGTVHRCGLFHKDLSLDNMLVCDSAGWDIRCLDWFKSFAPQEPDEVFFRRDMVDPVSDLFAVGIPESQILLFLEEYAKQVDWCRGRLEEVMEAGRGNRIRRSLRAYRNCDRMSHQVVRYRRGGRRVFRLKRIQPEQVDDFLFSDDSSNERASHVRHKDRDSTALDWWRIANLLETAGLRIHTVLAYSRNGILSRKENLCVELLSGAISLNQLPIGSRDRRSVLYYAGDLLRRMHALKISVQSVSLDNWFFVHTNEGSVSLYTTDLDRIMSFDRGSFEERFGWISAPSLRGLSVQDLLYFLKGYGDGTIDPALAKQILDVVRQRRAA